MTVFSLLFFQVVAEKVRIDNLPESELQALLDEVIHYRGKKDGEKGTELFQVRTLTIKILVLFLTF